MTLLLLLLSLMLAVVVVIVADAFVSFGDVSDIFAVVVAVVNAIVFL